jgi:putative heme-binding domain-containing protein
MRIKLRKQPSPQRGEGGIRRLCGGRVRGSNRPESAFRFGASAPGAAPSRSHRRQSATMGPFLSPLRRGVVAILLAAAIASSAHAAPSAAELEQAGNLFAISCSSSFCHGEAGIGARAPTLRNRNFPADYVRTTMLNGRSGTAMPAFKDALSAQEVDMIVAYVMSLSPNNHAAEASAGASVANARPAAPLDAQAQRGSAIFFDTSRPSGCALCHSYGQRGGPVGPDLSAVAGKSPKALYESIVKPAASAPTFPAITVITPEGQHVTGIKDQEDAGATRLYDLSSAPPVLRSFYTANGAKIDEAAPAEAPYRHDLSALSKEQIADLIAFLKSSAGGAHKGVTPQDFAQP